MAILAYCDPSINLNNTSKVDIYTKQRKQLLALHWHCALTRGRSNTMQTDGLTDKKWYAR